MRLPIIKKEMVKKAISLLSGGMDSATALAIAVAEGYTTYALTFNYNQKSKIELLCAKKIASYFKVREHKILKINLPVYNTSALTASHLKIPMYRRKNKIPSTYVPARNTLFLAYGLAWADAISADAIFIGASQIDYSGYPDCRAEYFKAFQKVAKLGTKSGVEGRNIVIKTPLISLKKCEIIKKGLTLGVPYEYTWSCYGSAKKPCMVCESCKLRAKGFREAGIPDPLLTKGRRKKVKIG
jgi:7-cyano-7-deazaguanine synthase